MAGMDLFMSSPPRPAWSQVPQARAVPRFSVPQSKGENFRKRMKIAYGARYNITLEVLMHRLDDEDVELAGRNRFMAGYKATGYYRCLQNEVLHCMKADATSAVIDGNYTNLRQQILQGSLPEQLEPFELTDDVPELSREEQKEKRPVIYTHYHVDEDGQPPTPSEYRSVIASMKDYIKVAEENVGIRRLRLRLLADEIDALMVQLDKKDDWSQALRYLRKASHIASASLWMEAMEERFAEIPQHENDMLLSAAVTETGWTVQPHVRRLAHFYHSGGNTLMAFVDATSQHSFGDKFRMRFVIMVEVVASADKAGGVVWEQQIARWGPNMAESVARQRASVMQKRDRLDHMRNMRRKQDDIERLGKAEAELVDDVTKAEQERKEAISEADDAYPA
ncbi:hypothetical protein LTR85_003763 [Meristemomyces frigidus]|nr:hypothetical protein LTR85_003763 [Meristemomyces frigidus]